MKTYPTLSLSYPPSHFTGIGEGWLNGGSAKREATMEQCAAYLQLQERRGKFRAMQ